MRCYFIRNGRIENVAMLRDGADEALIEQAKRLFQEHTTTQQYDGFEVWSGTRFIYREPSN
jgi:antibiotic biosynthesis monooxygenase (ABM) superfamily enzyme